jgi:hypothetical protein
MSNRRVWGSLALVLLSACIEEPPPETTASPALGCLSLVCGNETALGAYPFFELDEKRLDYSPVGSLKITDFRAADDSKLSLIIDGYALKGKKANGTILQKDQLAGATIKIEHKDGFHSFELLIEDADSVPYFEGGAVGQPKIPTYRMSYVEYQGTRARPRVDLCGSDLETDPILPKQLLFHQGDRYDPETGVVYATGAAAGSWFNVTCIDDALWKMAIFHYTETGSYGDFTTDQTRRTAMLQGIRADYCGTGFSMTESGTPLDWENEEGWLTIQPDPLFEAVWDGDGAICLNEPRLWDREDVPCIATMPRCDHVAVDGLAGLNWGGFEDGGYVATWSWAGDF